MNRRIQSTWICSVQSNNVALDYISDVVEQFGIACRHGNPYGGGHVRYPPGLAPECKQITRPNYSPFANKMPNNSADFLLGLVTSEYYSKGLEAYRRLFWPDFIEHDGCTFLAFDEQRYQEWFRTLEGDRERIEATMNHRHILDSLPEDVQDPTRDLVLGFGRLLGETWSAKLLRDFPDREFVVSFPEEYSEDLIDYEITFWQRREQT